MGRPIEQSGCKEEADIARMLAPIAYNRISGPQYPWAARISDYVNREAAASSPGIPWNVEKATRSTPRFPVTRSIPGFILRAIVEEKSC